MPVEPYDGGYFEIIADPFSVPMRVEQAHHDSENQHRSFAADGLVLRIRCRKDSNYRLQAVAGAGAHLVLDAGPVPLLADWHLRETKPDD